MDIKSSRYIVGSITRSPLQSCIIVLGLVLGLSVSAVAYFYVKVELQFNASWPYGDRLARMLVETKGLPGHADGVTKLAINQTQQQKSLLLNYFSERLEAVTERIELPVMDTNESFGLAGRLVVADNSFLDVFHITDYEGDLSLVFLQPRFIALSESYANRLAQKPEIGDRIVLISIFGGSQVEYEIAAIFRLPKHISSAVSFDMLTLTDNYSLPLAQAYGNTFSWDKGSETWVRMASGVSVDSLNARFEDFVEIASGGYNYELRENQEIRDHLMYRFQSLRDIHFDPVGSIEEVEAGDWSRVMIFAGVGMSILLVATLNSIGLSIACTFERRKEVGVRKIVGGTQGDVFLLCIYESLLYSFIAFLLIIAILPQLLEVVRSLLPGSYQIVPSVKDYLFLLAITSVIGLVNGAYPGAVLSRAKPYLLLKKASASSGIKQEKVRSSLVLLQFFSTTILLIISGAMYAQFSALDRRPLGFNPENLLLIGVGSRSIEFDNMSALKTEIEKLSPVTDVIYLARLPSFRESATTNLNMLSLDPLDETVLAQLYTVDIHYFDILKIPLLGGAFVDSATDSAGHLRDGQPIILNKSASIALGFRNPEDAIGKLIYSRSWATGRPENGKSFPIRVAGIVENNMFASVLREPQPEMYMPKDFSTPSPLLLVKFGGVSQGQIVEQIQTIANKINQRPIQLIHSIEMEIRNIFKQDRNDSRLIALFSFITTLLACIALYGLVVFYTNRTIKEVGIRKSFGAREPSIIVLFLGRYVRLAMLASLAAWLPATYWVLLWLKRFPLQLEKSELLPICLSVSVLVISLSVISILPRVTRAAYAKPVVSLREE